MVMPFVLSGIADVIRFVEASSSREHFAVEEQHQDSYIVHINYEPEIPRIGVGQGSAIFPELQRLARSMDGRPSELERMDSVLRLATSA
jgi:hypothetical protein